MGKHVRSGLLTIMMVGLMALPAFAQGLAIVNHGAPNTPITVSKEVMGGAGRTLTVVPPAGLNGVVYVNAQDLFAANIVFVNLTNATFAAGQQYRLCDAAGLEVANFNVPGVVASAPFQLIAPVILPNQLHLTSDGACAATGNQFRFVFLGNTGGNPGVSSGLINFRTIGVAGTIIDQTTNGVLVQAVQEYTAAVRTSQHFVDVLIGNGNEFTTQTGTNNVGALGVAPVIQADSLQGTGAANAWSIQILIAPVNVDDGTLGLTTQARITVTDDQNFQGVQRVFIADAVGAVCDSTQAVGSPQNRAGVNNPVNGSSFLVPAALFSATTAPGAVNFRFCALANGVDFLSAPRDIKAQVSIEMCTGVGQTGCLPPAPVTGVVQHWDLSGGDIRISGVRGDIPTNNNTLINLNNLGPTDGKIVRLQVYRTQTISTQAAPACTIAPVPGVTIHGNGGAQINAQQINALCLAQAPDLHLIVYAVRMILSYAPANLSANAFRQFPIGPIFLELPVLKLGNAYANE